MIRVLLAIVVLGVTACSAPEDAPTLKSDGTAEAAVRTALGEAVSPDVPLTVRVMEARRVAADTLRVELLLVNTAAPGSPEAQRVAGAVMQLAGLSLVSSDRRRRLFPLRDADGATAWGGLEPPPPGGQQTFWALFPSLPQGQDRVTVLLPGLPAITDVPVS
ncbi:MAG TPA: hypothetical protein VIL35_08130 [Vicinamibacterales bacterium]